MYHKWFYGLRIIIMTSSISDDVQATRGTAWWCDVLVACTCDGLPGLTSRNWGRKCGSMHMAAKGLVARGVLVTKNMKDNVQGRV